MIPRYLEDLAVVDDVDPRVANVREVEGQPIGDRQGGRRPHPAQIRAPFPFRQDRLIGIDERSLELLVVRGSGDVPLAHQKGQHRARDRLDPNPARDIPSAVSPHAIGDHQEESRPHVRKVGRPYLDGKDAVLVDGSHPPDVRREPQPPPGRTNDRVAHPRRQPLFRATSPQHLYLRVVSRP